MQLYATSAGSAWASDVGREVVSILVPTIRGWSDRNLVCIVCHQASSAGCGNKGTSEIHSRTEVCTSFGWELAIALLRTTTVLFGICCPVLFGLEFPSNWWPLAGLEKTTVLF